MPIKKISNKERKPVIKKRVTIGEVRNAIYSTPIPPEWREGQFVFNRASELYGDSLARSVGYDPFYNDGNIILFMEALTRALNKLN